MAIVTIDTDGDHIVRARGEADAERSIITVESNDDTAELTWGYEKTDGTFHAWPIPAFDVSLGLIINHLPGVVLMVRVSGITGNSVVLNVRP